MPDSEKKTESFKVHVTERMLIDLSREAAIQDRSLSDFVGVVLRRYLYGSRTAGNAEGSERVD